MTSKERMLCALERGKPDRLPVTVHQWQAYHLENYLGGISALEAFRRFGLDAQIQYFGEVGQAQDESAAAGVSTSQWRIEPRVVSADPDDRIVQVTVTTPEGTLTYETAGNRKTTWITEYPVKRDEDIRLIARYMPVPRLDLAAVSELYDQVGDCGILRGFVWGDQAGCWQHACCLMDVGELILAAIDKPDWVHEFLGILLEKKLEFIESMAGAKFDLIETGGGAASSTVISPALHRDFCLPYDRRMHDALHNRGFRVVYHTCGGTLGLEEMIVANGCDASETLAPRSIGSNQEPWEFAAKVAGRLALIGGLDQFNVVTRGTGQEIRARVLELFEKVGQQGGYICALSDHFFDTPLENLQALASAGRECRY
jgi:uroporphyrinogen-III decarboxylase